MILIVLRAGPRGQDWTLSSSSMTTFARPLTGIKPKTRLPLCVWPTA